MWAGSAGADSKVTKIFKRSGVGKVELDSASAGDVVSIAGAASAGIADTIGDAELVSPLSPGPIEPPTLRYPRLVGAHLSCLHLPACSVCKVYLHFRVDRLDEVVASFHNLQASHIEFASVAADLAFVNCHLLRCFVLSLP